MQIDFHHATTFVAARLAGFTKPDAEIIAYASQYVDDATTTGPVCFDNNAVFGRTSSAHKAVDLRNTIPLENQSVWMPFHFLPGNGGLPAGEDPTGTFVKKIVCVPHSPIARHMIRTVILEQDKRFSLHRLGVTLHVYADTWAHRGFAGVIHKINEVEHVKEIGKTKVLGKLDKFLWENVEDAIPPLGHGRANILPDMPFLTWEYRNGRDEVITRNNTDDFCEAADQMCRVMKQYLAKDPDAVVTGIGEKDMSTIRSLFSDVREEDGGKRHETWLEAIKRGDFSFGAEEISYAERGKDSWKEKALGTSLDLRVHTYQPSFLTSNWKLFHDAIQSHQFHVAHEILPAYGICAA